MSGSFENQGIVSSVETNLVRLGKKYPQISHLAEVYLIWLVDGVLRLRSISFRSRQVKQP